MTLIVGLNVGSYVLLGADTRVSWYRNGQLQFRDDEEKIRSTSAGLITGAGLCDLLDPVKKRLEKEEVFRTDRIVEIIREEREGLDGWPWLEDDRVKESLEITAWMLTYLNADDFNNPTVFNLRLALTIPQESYQLDRHPPHTAALIMPTGTTPEQADHFHSILNSELLPLTGADQFAENLAHHAALIGRVMRQVAAINDGVAPTFQLGIHLFPFQTAISSIIEEDGKLTWTWRRNATGEVRPKRDQA